MSRDHLVLAVSLVMLALSLRVGLGGLGGLIPTVQDGLRLSGTQASVLTALPSLCFALAGLAAGRVILRFGVHRVVVDGPSLRAVARTPLAWALALCFGCQAGQAYVQFGYWADLTAADGGTSSHAGQLIAVMNLTVIPMALCMPLFIRVAGRSAVLPAAFAGVTVAGYLGVLSGPGFLSGWLWASLLGLGGGAFTWVFSMVARQTRTPAATAQLAAFVQGCGYLIASGITVLFGVIHSAAGDWATPLTTVTAIAAGIGIFGWGATRCHDLEHYLGQRNEPVMSPAMMIAHLVERGDQRGRELGYPTANLPVVGRL